VNRRNTRFGSSGSVVSAASSPSKAEVIDLTPDKIATMAEINRALKPAGRIQITDIVVHNEVPQDAKDDIDLKSS
jgi:hypothetical protein